MATSEEDLKHRTRLVVGTVTVVGLMILILWGTLRVLMLVFAGVLLAVFLRGLSDWLSRYTPLSKGWSLFVVVLVLVGAAGLGVWLLAPNLAVQIDLLFQELPRAVQQVLSQLEQSTWGRMLLKHVQEPQRIVGGLSGVLKQASGYLSTTLGVLSSFVVVLFFGLYLAVDPGIYVDGLVRLVPPHRRERAREVIETLNSTLQWWLVGRMLSMALIGLLTGLGLWALGIPLALTIGLISAVLAFIPFIGPVISAVPAVLLGLTNGPASALYVTLLYVGIETVESYLITPLVQQRTVSLPPVLVLFAQIVMSMFLGILGLLLATPVAAVVLVLVKMLYVEDVLGEEITI